MIRGHHAGRHDGGRVIPTETAGCLFHRKVAAEAQEKSPRAVARVAQDANVNIIVRSDCG